MEEVLEYYDSLDYWLKWELAQFIHRSLTSISPYIHGALVEHFYIVTTSGQAKLRKEHPDIWDRFELDEVDW